VKRGSALDAPNSAVRLPQHPDQHRPKDPVLLAVDQQLGEGACLGVSPELSDPVGSLEVREHEDALRERRVTAVGDSSPERCAAIPTRQAHTGTGKDGEHRTK
jgi:hypothetical protein